MSRPRQRRRPGGTHSPRWWYARAWLLTLAAIDALTGLAYAVGPATSGNLVIVASIAPLPLWACLLAAVGIAIWLRWYRAAGVAGAAIWLFWTAALCIALARGTAPSAGGLPLFTGLAVFHLLTSYGAATGVMTTGRSSD